MANSFVINDEYKINSYGFKLLHDGINLECFQENPALISNHWSSSTSIKDRDKDKQSKYFEAMENLKYPNYAFA